MKDTTPLKIIVPVSMELDWPTKEAILVNIRELNRKYRFTWFALECPGGGWRSSLEYPTAIWMQKMGELFHDIKNELSGEGIHCGWWYTLTIKSSSVPEWQRIVRGDGSQLAFATCPLDPEYRRRFAENAAVFAKIGKPEFIITEDDYGLHGGCFCKRHLAEFSRREGREWTREVLVKAMEDDSPEARALTKRWCALKRETLADFAADTRAAVDQDSPEIPMGTCQSGSWDSDGDATEAVCRAFAGPKHRPFSRLYGTFYGGENTLEIPTVLHHPLYYKQHLPKDFICLHESDTFPHTRFFTSAGTMRVIMSTVYSQGYDGSIFQAQQLLDNPSEEKAYSKMHAEERDRFQAMHDASKQCTVKGVHLPFVPMFAKASTWLRTIAHFGIPYTTQEAPVAFLSGNQIPYLSDEELMDYFKKGLFLDGDAADALFKRGFGELMGCGVAPDAVSGKEAFDLGGREIIEPAFIPDSVGRNMHRAGYYSPGGYGTSFNLIPYKGAEVITRLVTFQKKELGVGMTRFVNKVGGRVVVMGMGTAHNRSSSLFNYRRQKLIQEQLLWCGGDVPFVKNEPRAFVVMNEADNPADADFFGMLTISNLNPDDLDEITLHLPEAWRHLQSVKVLDRNGRWQQQKVERTSDGIRILTDFRYLRPQVFLFA